MARQAVFSQPTRLWHASEGWVTFGIGEMDPGGAWFETEGGAPPAEGVIRGLQADLLATRDQVERLQRQIDSQSHSLATVATERDAANARAGGLQAQLDGAPPPPAAPAPEPDESEAEPEPPPPSEARPDIEIPAAWEALPFLALRALARKVSGQPVSDKPACEAAIRAHLAAAPNP